MPTQITQASDPTLWAELEAIRLRDEWIYLDQQQYRPVLMGDGSMAYDHYTRAELMDARSLIGSLGASYKELDG